MESSASDRRSLAGAGSRGTAAGESGFRYAGKNSIGFVVVMVTTSLASNLNIFTRATSLRSSSESPGSLETSRTSVTSPEGAIVTSRTTLPCRAGLSRSARL